MSKYGEPPGQDEVVVHVLRGTTDRVRIEELDVDQANAEITIRVSRNRTAGELPLLGVITK